MNIPVIDFTSLFYLVAALALFILCSYLSYKNKSNTISCIVLLCFLTILIGHSIELRSAILMSDVLTLIKNITFDELFIFAAFMEFLYIDHIQVEKMQKNVKTSKKSSKKQRIDDKVIDNDGLDFLWKKV